MSYREIKGDLIDWTLKGNFDVIAHQANCFHTMKSGIAKALVEQWPEILIEDIRQSVYGDYNKMGNYSTHRLAYYEKSPAVGAILNIYSQYNFGREPGIVYTDYDALRLALRKVNMEFYGKRIGLPLIGCGLAGGNWIIVRNIIQEELDSMNVTIVKYEK